jgi:hypothetical protein
VSVLATEQLSLKAMAMVKEMRSVMVKVLLSE